MQTKKQLSRQKDGYRKENEMVLHYLAKGMAVIGYINKDNEDMLKRFKPHEKKIQDILSSKLPLKELLKRNRTEALRSYSKDKFELLEIKSKGSITNVKSSHRFRFDCEESQIKKSRKFLENGIKVMWIFYIEDINKFVEVLFNELEISGLKKMKVRLPEKYRDLRIWKNRI